MFNLFNILEEKANVSNKKFKICFVVTGLHVHT